MRPSELAELFDYLADSRSRFLSTFRQRGWAEFVRDRGVSWGSPLAVLLHMLDDEEGWLQYAARGRSIVGAPDRRPDAYTSFEQVAEDSDRVAALTRALLAGSSEAQLEGTVEFAESTGTTRRPMQKILLHAAVDELAHLGELIGLLWQDDVKPPYLDWLDYRVA
ncbi:MAG TPA: DinB family protein [Thermoplasmata archaeon]|nr:DinB family protein [Thermoplasmata archaeon]